MRKSQDLWVATSPDEFIRELDKLTFPIVYKRGKYARTEYVDVTCTLDIETTNTPEDGFIYSIQLNVNGVNCLVRYVEDLTEILDRLTQELALGRDRKLVFYVHNLGYEYWYLVQILSKKYGAPDALYIKPHKPLFMNFKNGIEFRDSLRLFQKSLALATKGCSHEKMIGDLDYNMYRNPDTPLSPDEWNYCVNDVQGLYEAIERLKKERGYNQATLPPTNTGIVREAMNRSVSKDKRALKEMDNLKLNKEQMRLAYKCMGGGDTHGTRWRAGEVVDNCNSTDLKSAHPSQMLLWEFPYGKPTSLSGVISEKILEGLIADNHGWVGKVLIKKFRAKADCPDPTISVSKTEDVTGFRGADNGRLLGADEAYVYMDSNDFQRFRDAYKYKSIEGVDIVTFKLRMLPESFRNCIKDFYAIKETAEDGPDRVFAKICVNSVFGVCSQKTIRDEYSINVTDEDIITEKTGWEENLSSATEEEASKSQAFKFPFLWGLWTSSMTRLKLWELIKTVGWDDVLYWDTDSCKYEGDKCIAIEEYNARIKARCEEVNAVVINRAGEPVYIGTAEDEYPGVSYGYRRFTFLHAKCYAAEAWNKKTNEYEVATTIAGVGKAEGKKALDGDIARLADGLYIKDAGGNKLAYVTRPVCDRKFKRQTLVASYIYMSPRDYLVQSGIPDKMEIVEFENIAG